MRIWNPDPEDSQLLDWWLPLVRAGRHALDAQLPWLIVVDEWELAGRVLRRQRPDVWVYIHHRSHRELFVDDTGQPYRFIPTSRGLGAGMFREISIRRAVYAAGLPELDDGSAVAPPLGRTQLCAVGG